MKKLFILIFLLTVVENLVVGQGPAADKRDWRKFEQAEDYYKSENYKEAVEIYLTLLEKYPLDLIFKYRSGICYRNIPGKYKESIRLLEEIKGESEDFPDVKWHLGRAYHMDYRFDEAMEMFRDYLRENRLHPMDVVVVKRFIEFCENGKKYRYEQKSLSIQNLGPPVNTEAEEYVPVILPDESMLIYTYQGPEATGGKMDSKLKASAFGEYYEDVFVSYKDENGEWGVPARMEGSINTKENDASVAISFDGQTLLVYKSEKKNHGDLYYSHSMGEGEWSKPEPLEGEVNGKKSWEGSAVISRDGRTLYFSSDRPGGLGGTDIWEAKMQEDGTWGDITNLGPNVNSKYDEDAPFIMSDGLSLYWSSQGHSSMGGYDIFYSMKTPKGWGEPLNIGAPVNTPGDELYYVISADGETGYYSSDMLNGYGGDDIYRIAPGSFGDKPILAMIVGYVRFNDQPIAAKIILEERETGNNVGVFNSNKETGKYLFAAMPGNKYKITVEVDSLDKSGSENLDLGEMEYFVKVEHDFYLYTEEYLAEKGIKEEDIPKLQEVVFKKIEESKQIPKEEKFSVHDVFVAKTMAQEEKTDVKVSGSRKVIPLMDKGEFRVEVTLNKSDIQGYGKLREVIPVGFEAFEMNSASGIFSFQGDEVKILWPAIPEEEIITITYRVTTKDVSEAQYRIWGDFAYMIDEKEKGKTEVSPTPFNLEGEIEVVVEEVKEEKIEEIEEVTEVKEIEKPIEKEKIIEPVVKAEGCSSDLIDFSYFVGKDLNDKRVYNRLIKTGGNFCTDGLVFKVQIGAYRHPKNFKYVYLKPFGKAKIKDYADGITRFTLGEFKTLKEAEGYRQKVIKAGQDDAWITGFYNGKRMLMEDLIAVNFYGKVIN